jgi:adenylate kinase family enzyme
MTYNNEKMHSRFSSSFVLGGSPCSGKSTLAERLSTEHKLPYYRADDHMWRHLEQANSREQPTMFAYSKMSWDEMWSQPVNTQVQDVFSYYTEQYSMIMEDLLENWDQGPIIMEGAAFLPELLLKSGVRSEHAMFLVPSKRFQFDHYSQRDWIQAILDSCHDPDQAFANWMERDHRVGLEIIQQAQKMGYRTLVIDGTRDIDHIYSILLEHFSLNRTK